MAWVRWECICKPKSEGGLGIKNLELFNLALLAKWRWRFLEGEESTLWKKVITERYGRTAPWFDEDEQRRGLKGSSLWWRDITILGGGQSTDKLWFREVAKKKMGMGNNTFFWDNEWYGRHSLKLLFPSLYEVCESKKILVQDMGVWQDDVWRWEWSWMDGISNVDQQEIIALKDLLTGAGPVHYIADKWVWTLDSSRGFSVKSCYKWLNGSLTDTNISQEENETTEACRKLWKNDVPSKVIFSAWRLLLDRLATREALHKRGVLTSQRDLCCVYCFKELETIDQLFSTCAIIRKIWAEILVWIGTDAVLQNINVRNFQLFGSMIKGKQRKGVKHLVWLATVWIVWITRNNIIFQGKVANVKEIVDVVKQTAWAWFIARKGRSSSVSLSDWLNCPVGCLLSV